MRTVASISKLVKLRTTVLFINLMIALGKGLQTQGFILN